MASPMHLKPKLLQPTSSYYVETYLICLLWHVGLLSHLSNVTDVRGSRNLVLSKVASLSSLPLKSQEFL